MQHAIRDQVMIDKEAHSPVIDCTQEPDMARPEFSDEADLNTLINRYDWNTPTRQVTANDFGQVDWDLDLLTAHESVQAARRAWARLPGEIQERYPSWDQLLVALEQGEVTYSLDGRPEMVQTEPEETAAGEGGKNTEG